MILILGLFRLGICICHLFEAVLSSEVLVRCEIYLICQLSISLMSYQAFFFQYLNRFPFRIFYRLRQAIQSNETLIFFYSIYQSTIVQVGHR